MKNIFLLILVFGGLTMAQSNFKTLPNITLKTLTGKQVNSNELLKDGALLINFWATWCAPCKKEMRHLDKLKDQYKGFNILAINVDKTRSLSQVRSYIKTSGYDFIVGLDPNSVIMEKLNAKVVPTNLLINSDAEIVWQHQGYLPGDEKEMEEEIKKVLNISAESDE